MARKIYKSNLKLTKLTQEEAEQIASKVIDEAYEFVDKNDLDEQTLEEKANQAKKEMFDSLDKVDIPKFDKLDKSAYDYMEYDKDETPQATIENLKKSGKMQPTHYYESDSDEAILDQEHEIKFSLNDKLKLANKIVDTYFEVNADTVLYDLAKKSGLDYYDIIAVSNYNFSNISGHFTDANYITLNSVVDQYKQDLADKRIKEDKENN